jgi:hypothetical protein
MCMLCSPARREKKMKHDKLFCFVVGVHFNDGPDKPYYTLHFVISYSKVLVEKQTNADRVKDMPWNEGKTWPSIEEKL